MQELVKIGEKEFLTGLSSTRHLSSGGIFKSLDGLTVTKNVSYNNNDIAVLQATPNYTQVNGVSNEVLGYTKRITGGGQGNLYLSVKSDGVYSIDLNGDNDATQIFANTDLTGGLELFSPKDTTIQNLLYWQTDKVGLYGDLNGTPSQNDTWLTGLTPTSFHPTHKLWDEIYFGNGNVLGRIKDDLNGGMTTELNVLDFEKDMLITAVSDDGEYVVIGMSNNQGDLSLNGDTLLRFWQINQPSWTYEYRIPEPFIIDIKRIGKILYILCPYGLYYASRGTSPQKIIPLSITTYGNKTSMNRIGDTVLFPQSNILTSYGKLFYEIPTAWHALAKIPNQIKSIITDVKNSEYLLGDSTSLYRLKTNDNSYLQTGTAETIHMNLGVEAHITNIEIILQEPMQNQDTLSIYTSTSINEPFKLFQTAKASNRRKIILTKSGVSNVTELALKIEINGAVKIKQITVYGDIQT